MNRDDIIRMAVEAGFSLNELNKEDDSDHIWYEVNFTDLLLDLREFAKLVAAAEREAIAKFMLSVDLSGLKNDPALQHYTENLLIHNAKAIRARGQE